MTYTFIKYGSNLLFQNVAKDKYQKTLTKPLVEEKRQSPVKKNDIEAKMFDILHLLTSKKIQTFKKHYYNLIINSQNCKKHWQRVFDLKIETSKSYYTEMYGIFNCNCFC